MTHTVRIVAAALVGASLLSGCSKDPVSPNGDVTARFSGGSANAGGAGAGGSGTVAGGGGGAKTTCTNTLAVAGNATEALTGNTFSATYVLNACQSKTRVSMTATDLTTGFMVWSSVPDLAGTIALWTLPYNLTSYRIDARAVAGSASTVVATASTIVNTLDVLPCETFIRSTVTVGYWGIYAAVWSATDAQDCGRGGTVHLKITNVNTGRVELEYMNLSKSTLIDFEGPIVSYGTPYHVDAELRSSTGQLLATTSSDVVSAPSR